MQVDQPDEKSVITYVASLYNVFPLPSPSKSVQDNVRYIIYYPLGFLAQCGVYALPRVYFNKIIQNLCLIYHVVPVGDYFMINSILIYYAKKFIIISKMFSK